MRLPCKCEISPCIQYAMEMGPAPGDAMNWSLILAKWWRDQGADPETLPIYLKLWYNESDSVEELEDNDIDNFVGAGCSNDNQILCTELNEYPSFAQGCKREQCKKYESPESVFKLTMPKVSYEDVLGTPKAQQINVANLAEQIVRGMNIKRLPGGILAVYNQGVYVTGDADFLVDAVVRNYLKNELNTRLHSNLFLHIKALADPVAWDDFEIYPHLLCCPNGVVDLQTKDLLEHNPAYMMLHKTGASYRPHAEAPLWARLVREIVDDVQISDAKTEDQQDYYKTMWGYSITGETRDEVFFIHQGSGGSGKTTLTSGIQNAMGSYIQQVDPDILMTKGDFYKPAYELASGVGKRVFLTNESKEGAKIHTQLIKSVATEGAVFNARQIRERAFTYTIRAKTHLVMNPEPTLDEIDKAIERRLHVIRYLKDFTAFPDKTLKRQLRGEAEGILAWLIDGAYNYYTKGLIPTKAVSIAGREVFEDMDPLYGFVEATLEQGTMKDTVSSSDLFDAFKTYCLPLKVSIDKFDPKMFGRALNSQLKMKAWKYTSFQSHGKRKYKGLIYRSSYEFEE